MKTIVLLFWLLVLSYSYSIVHGQSVPTSLPIYLDVVHDVVHSHASGTTFDLNSCFTNANSAYFNPTYNNDSYAPAGSILRFRGYTVTACPNVNDSYQGGILAYKFVSGDAGYVAGECHGIIVSNDDLGNVAWGCEGTGISGADGEAIGTGPQNTLDIIAGCSTAGIAAKLCADYSNGGYSDWFLPSRDELMKVYESGVTGIASDYYWSSSEWTSAHATSITWVNGTISHISKNTNDRVRAIRYF